MTFNHPEVIGFTVIVGCLVFLLQVFVLIKARFDLRMLLHEQNTRAVERVLPPETAVTTTDRGKAVEP